MASPGHLSALRKSVDQSLLSDRDERSREQGLVDTLPQARKRSQNWLSAQEVNTKSVESDPLQVFGASPRSEQLSERNVRLNSPLVASSTRNDDLPTWAAYTSRSCGDETQFDVSMNQVNQQLASDPGPSAAKRGFNVKDEPAAEALRRSTMRFRNAIRNTSERCSEKESLPGLPFEDGSSAREIKNEMQGHQEGKVDQQDILTRCVLLEELVKLQQEKGVLQARSQRRRQRIEQDKRDLGSLLVQASLYEKAAHSRAERLREDQVTEESEGLVSEAKRKRIADLQSQLQLGESQWQ